MKPLIGGTRGAHLLLGVLGFMIGPLSGADVPGENHSIALHHPGRAWLQPYDPTLLTRRLLTEFDHEERENGHSNEKWLWNARGAIQVTESIAFGAQLEVPWRWVDTPEGEDAGWGDLEARLGFASHLTPTARWGLGLNAKFPTGSELLGDGVFELRPIAAVRWSLTHLIQMGASFEYSFTPRDEGTADVSALEIKLPITVKLGEMYSAFTSYKPRWNFANDTDRHRLEFGLTRLLGAHKEYAVSLGAEVPLTDETLDWKGNLGFSWFF
jgi:hypothetical protein